MEHDHGSPPQSGDEGQQSRERSGRPGLWALLILLVVGSLFFVTSGRSKQADPERSGEDAGAMRPEPNVVVVSRDGKREEMPIETYIQGVVAGEMGRLPPKGQEDEADWPAEAYAAQAILARSFTMHYLEERGGNEISDEHQSAQAYNPDNIIPAIKKGVEDTRGEVMLYKDEYVRAMFHSYSGGQTATAEEGLQQENAPYLKSVKPGHNQFAPNDVTQWTFEMPLAEVAKALKEAAAGPDGTDVGAIKDVRIAERGPSRRVTKFEIIGEEDTVTMGGNDFRLAVGPERLKSTLLEEMKVEGDRLVANGTGFGHGVGLSQWDTYMMAKDKRKPEDIVEFFFQDVEIRKLWN